MPDHPLRAVRLYVDWQAYGFAPPALHELPEDVADDLRFLAANVELPEREDDDKHGMRDREDD
jgi:hypothetical protein